MDIPDEIHIPDEILSRLPGRLLFAKIWGSHSHNTALPESDVDYLAVYACTPRQLLALHPAPETVSGNKPDFQAHEARKFASLLLKGNPGVVECLFTERDYIESPEWLALRKMRGSFLNEKTLHQYLGYCRGQLQRMSSGKSLHTAGSKFNTKWAYHMIRLALDAERISSGQAPVVWKEGAEQALLMDIRRGVYNNPMQLKEMYETIEAHIDATKPWPIPAGADEDLLNSWLFDVYGLASKGVA
jgi:uncharacterized protein